MNTRIRNKRINKKSGNILEDVLCDSFNSDNIDITPLNIESQDDDGEDFTVNLNLSYNNPNENIIEHFYIQNKGKEDISGLNSKHISRNGYFQFPLKTRNAERYYSILQNPIITLVDNALRQVFWYSIQLDKNIENLISESKSKGTKSIQISIPKENLINKSNAKTIINEILLSKAIIAKRAKPKHDRYNESNILLSNDYSKGSLIDNLLSFINHFEGLMSIPHSLFKNLSPFTIIEKNETSFENDSFVTDNIELIDLFESISLKKDTIVFSKGNKYKNEKNIEKSLKTIINFLVSNNIQHLSLKNEYKRRVCIHNLYISEKCNCLKCLLDKNDIKSILKIIDKPQKKAIEEFKRGFVLSSIYRYADAIGVFKGLHDSMSSNKNPLLKLLCCYNISKLYKICKYRYWGHELAIIEKNISKYDFDENYIRLKNNLRPEIEYFIDFLISDRFYTQPDWEINEVKNQLERNFISDNFGGASRNSHLEKLFTQWNRFHNFTHSNNIVYEVFNEYDLLKNKVTESFICSYSIKNIESSKLENFNETFIGLLISTDYESLEYFFNKYDVSYLEFGDSLKKTIELFKINFTNIFNSFKLQYEDLNKNVFDSYYSDNIAKQFSTCLFLLYYIKFENSWVNNVLISIQKIVISLPEKTHIHFLKVIYKLLCSTKIKITLETQVAWFEYSCLHKDMYCMEIVSNFAKYLKHQNQNCSLSDKISKSVFVLIEKSQRHHSISNSLPYMIEYFELMNKHQKLKFKKIIQNTLEESFVSRVYYVSSLHGIIDYKEYFTKYIGTIPSCEKQAKNLTFFSHKERNSSLNEFINLCFKFNIRLETYQHLHSNIKYYEWLMNLESFDYKLFDPYWLIQYNTKYYIQEFKKYPIIREKLLTYILQHKVKGLINIYIKHFAD